MEENIIFKRKFRWLFEAEFKDVKTGPHFVKVGAMPQIDIIEEIGSDGVLRIKDEKWQPITTTFFSSSPEDKEMQSLYRLIALFYDFGSKTFSEAKYAAEVMEKTAGNLGNGTLTLYDGCGYPLEQWTLNDLWPHSINFGELCYSSSEEVDVEITWRFMGIKYENMIGKGLEQAPWGNKPWPSGGTMGLGKIGDPNIIF